MRTPEEIVRAEVLCCMSYLVATLANGAGQVTRHDSFDNPVAGDTADLCDQAAYLTAPIDDWEEAAIQAGAFKDLGVWRIPDRDDGAFETAEGLCIEHGIDPYQREVFEHWAVTGWLADALEAEGEKVDRDFSGLCVWARTTTGQGIAADYVMERVAAAAETRYREAVAAAI